MPQNNNNRYELFFKKKIQSSTYIKRFSHRPFIPCRELLLFLRGTEAGGTMDVCDRQLSAVNQADDPFGS